MARRLKEQVCPRSASQNGGHTPQKNIVTSKRSDPARFRESDLLITHHQSLPCSLPVRCRGASVLGAPDEGPRGPRCLGGKPRRVGTRASASRRHRRPLRVKKAVRGLGTLRSPNPWKWPSANDNLRTSSWPRSRVWPSVPQKRTTFRSGRRARVRSCGPPRGTTRRSSGRGCVDPRPSPPRREPR